MDLYFLLLSHFINANWHFIDRCVSFIDPFEVVISHLEELLQLLVNKFKDLLCSAQGRQEVDRLGREGSLHYFIHIALPYRLCLVGTPITSTS